MTYLACRSARTVLPAAICLLFVILADPVGITHAMDGGGDSDRRVTPLEPNAIERELECKIDTANKIGEAREELNKARAWRLEYQKTIVNDEIDLRNAENDLEKERRSAKPDKKKIKNHKKNIKDLKKQIRKNKSDLKKLEKIINKQKKVLRGC